MTHRLQTLAISLPLATLFPTTAFACATCGCSLSSDAALGYASSPGWSVSVQYDYINQNQLRIGTHSVSTPQVASINDAGGDQEVEHETVNRYATVGLAYSPNADWNMRLLVPYIDRSHSTYSSTSNPVTSDQLSGSTVKGLGDVRFITTFQGALPDGSLGLQLGVKLPTGRYGGASADDTQVLGRRPTAFSSGPLSENSSPDNLVDTALQPGTGSTDAILGVYYHRAITDDIEAFVSGQFQAAFTHHLDRPGEDFRPGNTTTISFGVRYEAFSGLVPQVQVNVMRKSRDQGALADNPDSAGTVAYVSPGMTAAIGSNVEVFAFAQVPFYRNLIGYQLAPRWTASAGMRYSF